MIRELSLFCSFQKKIETCPYFLFALVLFVFLTCFFFLVGIGAFENSLWKGCCVTTGISVPVKLILDTGYTDALSIDVSSSENLSAPQHFYHASLKGMSGRESAMIANTQSIMFGANSIANFPGFYEESSNISDVNGVMGNKILSQYNLVFDYENEQLFIKPNQRFAMPISMDKRGLQVYPHLLGGYIDDVATDSGAELLGLKRGDNITTFNETKVTDETLTLLQKALGSSLATIDIYWISKGQKNCNLLTLSSLL